MRCSVKCTIINWAEKDVHIADTLSLCGSWASRTYLCCFPTPNPRLGHGEKTVIWTTSDNRKYLHPRNYENSVEILTTSPVGESLVFRPSISGCWSLSKLFTLLLARCGQKRLCASDSAVPTNKTLCALQIFILYCIVLLHIVKTPDLPLEFRSCHSL